MTAAQLADSLDAGDAWQPEIDEDDIGDGGLIADSAASIEPNTPAQQ